MLAIELAARYCCPPGFARVPGFNFLLSAKSLTRFDPGIDIERLVDRLIDWQFLDRRSRIAIGVFL
ncbi:MAG TPA: hypothetical protein PK402_13395 [Tepidisphaeraceae bacterium]|nr:hypothetical protein [Tepidisphaeraceae bacterium]